MNETTVKAMRDSYVKNVLAPANVKEGSVQYQEPTPPLWKHKKTGNLYLLEGYVTNATNEQSGQVMVLYCRHDNSAFRYCREKVEFMEKFEVMPC